MTKTRIHLTDTDPAEERKAAERRAGRRRPWGLQRMVVVSLILHMIGFVSYAVMAAARFKPPEKDMIPVTLVPMAPPQPTIQPKPEPPPPPEDIRRPTVPDPLDKPPVKKEEEPPVKPPEPEEKPVEKPKEEPPPPKDQPRTGVISDEPPRKVEVPKPSLDPVGDIEVEAPEFEFAYYLKAIRRKIASKWNPPTEVPATGETTGVIRFVIQRSGEVTEVSVWEESGTGVFDLSALRAVQIANLPPLPPEYASDQLGIKLRFVR